MLDFHPEQILKGILPVVRANLYVMLSRRGADEGSLMGDGDAVRILQPRLRPARCIKIVYIVTDPVGVVCFEAAEGDGHHIVFQLRLKAEPVGVISAVERKLHLIAVLRDRRRGLARVVELIRIGRHQLKAHGHLLQIDGIVIAHTQAQIVIPRLVRLPAEKGRLVPGNRVERVRIGAAFFQRLPAVQHGVDGAGGVVKAAENHLDRLAGNGGGYLKPVVILSAGEGVVGILPLDERRSVGPHVVILVGVAVNQLIAHLQILRNRLIVIGWAEPQIVPGRLRCLPVEFRIRSDALPLYEIGGACFGIQIRVNGVDLVVKIAEHHLDCLTGTQRINGKPVDVVGAVKIEDCVNVDRQRRGAFPCVVVLVCIPVQQPYGQRAGLRGEVTAAVGTQQDVIDPGIGHLAAHHRIPADVSAGEQHILGRRPGAVQRGSAIDVGVCRFFHAGKGELDRLIIRLRSHGEPHLFVCEIVVVPVQHKTHRGFRRHNRRVLPGCVGRFFRIVGKNLRREQAEQQNNGQ